VTSKVIIITGAARGIGLACARKFLSQGDRVVLCDLDETAGHDGLASLGVGEDEAVFVKCDVSKKIDVHNLIAECLTAFDRLDVLVNNAGIIAPGDILSLSEADFLKVLNVNLTGHFLTAQAAARQMVAQIEAEGTRRDDARRRYAIVNMASVNAVTAMADQLAYNVSKGGILQLTRAMALGLARHGIRVNAVGPGAVSTDMMRAVLSDPDAMARLMLRIPMGRIADVDEIAEVVHFLASPGASYITGETIYADGGRLALNMTMAPQADE
jgi:glucose 1-dehydrogenase